MKRSEHGRRWVVAAAAAGIAAVLIGILWVNREVSDPDSYGLPEGEIGLGSNDAGPIDTPTASGRSPALAAEPEIAAPLSAAEPSGPEPWRKLRLDEIDRQLGVLIASEDPTQRQMELQHVLVTCISPLADEMGLSTPTIGDGVTRRVIRNPNEHHYTFGNNEYRIPEGLFAAFDEFHRVWNDRIRRLSELSSAEAAIGLPDPWPLDPQTITELEVLAERAKAAIRRRQDPY